MITDTILEDDRWQDADLPALAEGAARATLVHLGVDPGAFEIAVLGCDDARISALNADFRGKPAATNVLSWPTVTLTAASPGAPPEEPRQGGDEGPQELGDIAIAYDTCAREAAASGKPLADHVTHLIVHATLHLLGYDHIRDLDATLMETKETAILGEMGLANPYEDR